MFASIWKQQSTSTLRRSQGSKGGRRTRFGRRFGPALLASLMALAVVGTAWASARHSNENGDIETTHPDWMKWLPNDLSLADLSLPGTHDTMASNALDITPSSETQSLSLQVQLEAGIRAVDMRARHIHNQFDIHHSKEYLDDFEYVMYSLVEFINVHP